jgi:hypothetical protein
MRKVETLIDTAARCAGSQAALARAIGATRSQITDWKAGRAHVPDKSVLAMARVAGWNPMHTAMEVYKGRLGELAKTLAIGAVAITLACVGAGDARAAATKPNV